LFFGRRESVAIGSASVHVPGAMVRASNGTRLDIMIKRIACAALALSLLGSTAAQAAPWGHGGWHHHGGWRGAGPAFLGFGLGLLALGAIASSDARDEAIERDRYERDRAYEQDREFRDHGYEPGYRGGPYQGDDEGNGPGRDRAYRDAPAPRDGDYRNNAPDSDDRDAPPPSHNRAHRDAPPPPDGDRDGDARGAPHPLHQDNDGDDN
jgi:hypothetical protein